MSRLKRAEAALRAAEHWKERCLLGQGSVFWDDKKLWTLENFEALSELIPKHRQSMKHPELMDWLQDASADVKRLATEVTWFEFLSDSKIKSITKTSVLQEMWKWLGEPYPKDNNLVAPDTLMGVVKARMYNHRGYEYRFLCERMKTWYGLDSANNSVLIDDPWKFGEWIHSAEDIRRRHFKHVLCYFLFPEQYEPLVFDDKRDIVKALAGDKSIQVDKPLKIDRALLEIRKQLQRQSDVEVDFGEEPWRSQWSRGAAPHDSRSEEPNLPPVDYDAWYQKEFDHSRVWLMAAGKGGTLWRNFVNDRVASLGWDVGDLRDFEDEEELMKALIASRRFSHHPLNIKNALWDFVDRMKKDDIIVARGGRDKILGVGTVSGDYTYDESVEDHRHRRKMDWRCCEPAVSIPHALADIPRKTLTDRSDRKDWLHDLFELVEPARGPCNSDEYRITDALKGLFIDDKRFKHILQALCQQTNLILQGPPGTGKTFMAKRLASCLIGRRDSRPIEMVQFHQSYAYEDFVQGYRPTETGGFTLRNGVFYEFCERARRDEDTPHVFITDEINRGNMSRIFGELLMLIEPDKRSEEYAVPLTYSKHGERFFVPPNVHILGMMNTADRSLAVVDYALRRRFAFKALKPEFNSPKFKKFLLEKGVDEELVERIRDRMNALNKKIREDTELGPGFEIGHSYFVPGGPEDVTDTWYEEIIQTQIAPLLREYWFEDAEKADQAVKDLLA